MGSPSLVALVEACRTDDDAACARLAQLAIADEPPPPPAALPPDASVMDQILALLPPGTDPARLVLRDWAATQSCRRGDPLACRVVAWNGPPGTPWAPLPDPLPTLAPDAPVRTWAGAFTAGDHTFAFDADGADLDGARWLVVAEAFGVRWMEPKGRERVTLPPPCPRPVRAPRSFAPVCTPGGAAGRKVVPTWRFDLLPGGRIRAEGPGWAVPFLLDPVQAEWVDTGW